MSITNICLFAFILICHQAVPTSGQIHGPYINPEDCALLSYGGPAKPQK